MAGVLAGTLRRAADLCLPLLGDAQLHSLGGRLDVPVAERRDQQLVDDRRRSIGERVVACCRTTLVGGNDLQVAQGLEVDGAQVDAAPGRVLGAPTTRRDRAHQRLLVEQQRAQRREGARKVLWHAL